jgi:hypothetical protein
VSLAGSRLMVVSSDGVWVGPIGEAALVLEEGLLGGMSGTLLFVYLQTRSRVLQRSHCGWPSHLTLAVRHG